MLLLTNRETNKQNKNKHTKYSFFSDMTLLCNPQKQIPHPHHCKTKHNSKQKHFLVYAFLPRQYSPLKKVYYVVLELVFHSPVRILDKWNELTILRLWRQGKSLVILADHKSGGNKNDRIIEAVGRPLLIIYSAFGKCLRKNGNTMKQCITSL